LSIERKCIRKERGQRKAGGVTPRAAEQNSLETAVAGDVHFPSSIENWG